MAFTAKFSQFKKKVNSTKQPDYNSVVTWSTTVELIEPCSVMYPRIVVRRSNAPYPEEPGNTKDIYNYCWLDEFSRYYWIKDWTYDDGLWIADMECDVLASFKSNIGSTSLYVLRASALSDGTIRDNLYPMKASPTLYHQLQSSTTVPGGYSTGWVVLNIAGTNSVGASTLIQVTPSDFRTLISNLYTAINGFQLSDVLAKLGQFFGGNPQDLINSAMWFPYQFVDSTYVSNVKIGGWSSGVSGYIIDNPVWLITNYDYTLTKHPKAATRGAYLNYAPYTNYYLGLPGVGVITLDTSRLINETKIVIDQKMDAVSGECIVTVRANTSSQIIAYLKKQMGVAINLRGSSNGGAIAAGMIDTAAKVAAAAYTGGATSIISAASSGIGLVDEAIGGTATSTGMGGGLCHICNEYGFLDTVCYDIVDENNTRYGRPLCQTKTPATLGSGYILAKDGTVPIYGTQEEADRIKAFIEGGFYYE